MKLSKIFLAVAILPLLVSFSAKAVSTNSIYNLEGTWKNQEGAPVAFPSLSGKVRIVSMIFTRCPSACPMIVGDIKLILSKLPVDAAKKVSIDLFSFDHLKDDPKTLKAFTKKMKIEDPAWSVYTSDKQTISELAAVLGVQYKALEGGAYVHSNNIILINTEGEILKTIDGYDASAEEFIVLLKKELAK